MIYPSGFRCLYLYWISSTLFIVQRGEKQTKKKIKDLILLKTSSDPLNMCICSLTVEEALSDWLRYRHFHCDLEGPNFHRWNRCVLSSGAAEPLLMVSLETRRHCMHEKYCWQQCPYHVILRNWAKILIPPFTFLNLFDRYPTIPSSLLAANK